MPTQVYILIQGLIDIYRKGNHEDTQFKSSAKTNPDVRVLQRALRGNFGAMICTLTGNLNQTSTVGEDCILFDLSSQFTFIAKSTCMVLAINSDSFKRQV